jgi:hypothetical protein
MKGRNMFRNRRLSFEGLERRAMLATVSFSGGILFITGNETAETVQVTEVTPGTVTVTGTGITTPVTRSGVIGIVADMRGGDDELTIGTGANSVDLRGPVSILLGNGEDAAVLFLNTPSAVTVDGGFQVFGAQDDAVVVQNSNLGALTFNSYAGDDALVAVDSFFGTLAANLGVGALLPGQVDADAFVMVRGGATTAAINLGTVEAGENNAAVIQGPATFSTLVINGGEGEDAVTLFGGVVANSITINTFGGNDTITLVGVVATNSLVLTAGAGADNVFLGSVVTAFALLDGGSGIDTLNDDTSPAIGTRLKFGWENDDPLL